MVGDNSGLGLDKHGSNITISEEANHIENHHTFGVSKRFTVAASGDFDILIDPTENGTYALKNYHILPFRIKAYGGGPLNITTYTSPTFTAESGTVWALGDRNGVSSTTAHTVIRYEPTISSVGTSGIEDAVFSAASIGAFASVGGETIKSLPLYPDPTLVYLIRIVNTSADEASAVFSMNIEEF